MLVDKHIYIYLSMKEVEVSLCFVFNLISYVGFFIHCFLLLLYYFKCLLRLYSITKKQHKSTYPDYDYV